MFRIEWKKQVLRTFTQRFDQLSESDQNRVMDSLDATDRLLVEIHWKSVNLGPPNWNASLS